MDPQETPFLLSISENLENTTVDQLVGDLQSTICNIQSENEWLCKEIRKVTTLKENFKLEVEELTHQISKLLTRVFTIDIFESDKDVTFYKGFPNRIVFKSIFEFFGPWKGHNNNSYWHSDDSATVNNQNCDEEAPNHGRPRQLNPREEFLVD